MDLPYAGFPHVTAEGEIDVLRDIVGITHSACSDEAASQSRKGDGIAGKQLLLERARNGFYVICSTTQTSITTGWLNGLMRFRERF